MGSGFVPIDTRNINTEWRFCKIDTEEVDEDYTLNIRIKRYFIAIFISVKYNTYIFLTLNENKL